MNNTENQFNNFHSLSPWELSVRSPGRINLIGEHTDYNQGFVLPTAIEQQIEFSFRKTDHSDQVRIFSQDFNRLFDVSINSEKKSEHSWENYFIGVLAEFQNRGLQLSGFDCSISSSIPIGAGLSSSAALVCGFAAGINDLFLLGLSKNDIVQIGFSTEHDFVGLNCGIMDHTACVMSQAKSFILLDCQDNQLEYVPFSVQNLSLVLLNTNVSHQLTETEYNTRHKECAESVQILAEFDKSIKSLRDVSEEFLQKHKAALGPLLYKRCRFVLDENKRVLEAVKSIETNQFEELGQLLYQSHQGLRNDYQVSCTELDFLVDFTKSRNEVLGSRMMGGGFGGCTINLIQEDKLNTFVSEISRVYAKEFGIPLTYYVVKPSKGLNTEQIRRRKP